MSPEPDAATEAWLARICAADRDAAPSLTVQAMTAMGAAAPALLDALKDASKAKLTVDPARALILAEALLAGAEAADLPWHLALGRMARGDAFSAQGGRVGDAVAELDAAAEAFTALEDPVAWARTRIGWIYLRCLSGVASAVDFATAERARDGLVEAGESGLAFTLDRNLMLGYWQLGRLDQADLCFARALSVTGASKRGPGPLDEAWLRANRGLMLTAQARLDEALAEHERARAIFERLGQRDSLRREEHNLGHLRLAMGEPGRALGHCLAALALSERDGLALPRGLVLASVARCHLALGSPDAAVTEAREALSILRAQGADAEALRCSLDLARSLAARADRTDTQEAEAILEACLADPRLPGLRAQDGLVRLDLAELALRRGDPPAAASWSAEAASRFRAGGLGLLGRLADLVAGEAALAAGHLELAGAAVERVLGAAAHASLSALQPRAWHLSARLAEARGRQDAACLAYGAAIDALDAQLRRLPPMLRAHLLDPRLDLLGDALDCYRHAGDREALWWMLERVKAGVRTGIDLREEAGTGALEAVAGIGAPTGTRAAPRHERAEERGEDPAAGLAARLDQLERTQAQLFGLRHAPDWMPALSGSVDSDPDDLDRRLEAVEVELLRLREARVLAAWRPSSAIASPGRRADWLAPVTAESTVLAAFGMSSEPFVIVTRGERRGLVDLPAGAARIGALADAWREAVEEARAQSEAGLPDAAVAVPLRGLLTELYAILVEPWQAWLDGAERLIVLPHGALHGLPFAALYDGQRHLLEAHVLGSAPSLAWWSACQQRGEARPRGLVAACSHDGALPGAVAEARSLARILGLTPLLETAATRQAVMNGLQSAGLVHLAAHAASRPDRPAFAHVWLADGPLLSSHDLSSLDLTGALVTLSGCETATGRRTGADEVLSLSRACLQAGAASVLGSLWPLRDVAALPLMTRVYEGLAAGRPVGDALRRAQLDSLHGDWPNPLDWAAFQVQGSCDTMLPSALIQGVSR